MIQVRITEIPELSTHEEMLYLAEVDGFYGWGLSDRYHISQCKDLKAVKDLFEPIPRNLYNSLVTSIIEDTDPPPDRIFVLEVASDLTIYRSCLSVKNGELQSGIIVRRIVPCDELTDDWIITHSILSVEDSIEKANKLYATIGGKQ